MFQYVRSLFGPRFIILELFQQLFEDNLIHVLYDWDVWCGEEIENTVVEVV